MAIFSWLYLNNYTFLQIRISTEFAMNLVDILIYMGLLDYRFICSS